MRKVFADTNIIVDFIANREPFGKFAIEIFDLAEKNKIKLYVSSHSLATTYYLLKKYVNEQQLRDIILSLTDFVEVIAVDKSVIEKSIRSKYKDFEDAIQIFSAHSMNYIDFIVTRNLKDFKDAGIIVLPPDELLLKLRV